MVDELTRCPNCKTRTLVKEGDELICSECHGHFPAPVSKDPPTKKYQLRNSERHVFYEKNRAEIIRDLLIMGRLATRKKWGIPASSLPALEKRWLAPDQKALLDGMPLKSSKQAGGTPKNGRLPQLPEFSSSWEPQVQVMWFEIYGKLLERHSIQNVKE